MFYYVHSNAHGSVCCGDGEYRTVRKACIVVTVNIVPYEKADKYAVVHAVLMLLL